MSAIAAEVRVRLVAHRTDAIHTRLGRLSLMAYFRQ
jgi:hypothetical protein